MITWSEPSEDNQYLATLAARLVSSLRRWTGKNLANPALSATEQARALFYAPFALISHDTAKDPLLNYANRTALNLFELDWNELIILPSRCTAQPMHQEERARLLATVTRDGFIDDYCGVRITKSGRRFLIEQATVWNLVDERDVYCGQAATFSRWRYLDE
jgi:hypothetical protein